MRFLSSWPLLAKELSEIAARRRTYVLRSVYALLLFAVFALVYDNQRRSWGNPMGMLGSGVVLFDGLFYCQYWAILVLMPALTAGSITREKEQGSLTLMLLTDLRPAELVLQKWMSALVAVGGYLLLGMPLMAVCYAYGGFAVERLTLGISVLVLTAMQTAAVALAMSAWCRGTVGALFASYLALAAIYAGPPLVALLLGADSEVQGWAAALWPEHWFPSRYTSSSLLATAKLGCLWVAASIAAFLILARRWVVSRAVIPGSNPVLRQFKRLDTFFEQRNAALGWGRHAENLPGDEPVVWHEFNRRSLANWRYLVRIMLPVTGLLALGIACIGTTSWHAAAPALQIAGLCLLGVASLLALLLGASLIASERSQQTLDVLLTTPLRARDILLQKMAALRRILLVVSSTGLLCALGRLWIGTGRFYDTGDPTQIIAAIADYLIVPPLFAWMAVAIGLHIHSRNRAVLTALIVVCAWLGSIMVLGILLFGVLNLSESSAAMLPCYLTPGGLALVSESNTGEFSRLWAGLGGATAIWTAWHGALLLLLRWWCLRHADRLMRRTIAA